jgi:hypothetical protein
LAFSYAWLAADTDNEGDSNVEFRLEDKSFGVASCDFMVASGDDPARAGSGGLADSTEGRVLVAGRAIPKSGVDVSGASFVELKSGNGGSELGEFGKDAFADGDGVATDGSVGAAVNNPGLAVGDASKIGVVGKVAVPAKASSCGNWFSCGNWLFALGVAVEGAGVEANPALGVELKAAQGSVVAAVGVDGLLLLAVKGPVTPDISGVVVSRSTRFSSSGFNVVFVPLSATKPP